MSASRRDFLKSSSVLFAAAAAAQLSLAQEPPASPQQPPASQPGTPPAFGTAPPVGPEVSPATFEEAEKLARVEMTPHDRAQAALNWRQSMAALNERRNGPRWLIGPGANRARRSAREHLNQAA
jgi:hypothetical protein